MRQSPPRHPEQPPDPPVPPEHKQLDHSQEAQVKYQGPTEMDLLSIQKGFVSKRLPLGAPQYIEKGAKPSSFFRWTSNKCRRCGYSMPEFSGGVWRCEYCKLPLDRPEAPECSVLDGVLCRLFGHKYFVIKRFDAETRKVGCKRCHRAWGMNDRVKAFVEWDADLELLHNGPLPLTPKEERDYMPRWR